MNIIKAIIKFFTPKKKNKKPTPNGNKIKDDWYNEPF